MKSLIFDSTKIGPLFPRRLILTYSCEGYALSDTFFTELSYQFSSYVQFYLGSHFPSCDLASHQRGKVNQPEGKRAF